ncbi:4-hydroxythreonine-4-phosphate dehydrogenase [Ereboglobus sp. PH5-10]|uniref:4-hydroxythreonine-4-phosphate dehydrogenase PdxA n=1 Tax=Ereboglobus sp. PH5-10 TaxID=2940629 RepID=UPI002405E89F|nr:4-hydroxythreonine-4-phosphate dehydrogenase PdxA [Ereboglobus sp. PH5-10]MDF9827115.1 4-hydroxythreonine-4-phosphate dehydrogenase [Ereboglobus sp. PH5-10]
MSAKLAFTCGDPAGVGPEIIAAWLAAHPARARDVAVIGPAQWLRALPSHTPAAKDATLVSADSGQFEMTPGRPSVEGARIALAAMERAAEGVRNGEFSGVVTGPVSKSWLQKAGYPFPGQTEFFAARWGGVPTMAFCGGRLRVVLLTWHIPLREVPEHLTPGEISRAVRAADELARADGIAAPRIGVCGLNPHAGEGGMLGVEERDTIDPLLDTLRAGGCPKLSRCEPSDTIFGRALRGEFDVIVALYHDQGLAPLKTIDFDEAVNVTLGLPHVRTSPDHGTAFGIAGKGEANPRSFTNAVTVAQRLIALRAG